MCSFMIKHIQTPSKMSDLKTYRCMAYTLLEEVANPQLTFEMCEALMDGCVDKVSSQPQRPTKLLTYFLLS